MANKNQTTKIRKIMQEKGITHQMLHDITCELFVTPIGMDRISIITTGKVENINVFTILKLAYALGVTPNDIIEHGSFIEQEMKIESKSSSN